MARRRPARNYQAQGARTRVPMAGRPSLASSSSSRRGVLRSRPAGRSGAITGIPAATGGVGDIESDSLGSAGEEPDVLPEPTKLSDRPAQALWGKRATSAQGGPSTAAESSEVGSGADLPEAFLRADTPSPAEVPVSPASHSPRMDDEGGHERLVSPDSLEDSGSGAGAGAEAGDGSQPPRDRAQDNVGGVTAQPKWRSAAARRLHEKQLRRRQQLLQQRERDRMERREQLLRTQEEQLARLRDSQRQLASQARQRPRSTAPAPARASSPVKTGRDGRDRGTWAAPRPRSWKEVQDALRTPEPSSQPPPAAVPGSTVPQQPAATAASMPAPILVSSVGAGGPPSAASEAAVAGGSTDRGGVDGGTASHSSPAPLPQLRKKPPHARWRHAVPRTNAGAHALPSRVVAHGGAAGGSALSDGVRPSRDAGADGGGVPPPAAVVAGGHTVWLVPAVSARPAGGATGGNTAPWLAHQVVSGGSASAPWFPWNPQPCAGQPATAGQGGAGGSVGASDGPARGPATADAAHSHPPARQGQSPGRGQPSTASDGERGSSQHSANATGSGVGRGGGSSEPVTVRVSPRDAARTPSPPRRAPTPTSLSLDGRSYQHRRRPGSPDRLCYHLEDAAVRSSHGSTRASPGMMEPHPQSHHTKPLTSLNWEPKTYKELCVLCGCVLLA